MNKQFTKQNKSTKEQETNKYNNNKLIFVIMQAMYGNRTGMRLREDEIDNYILENLSDTPSPVEEIDRSIIRIPNSKCVIVYNKLQEQERLQRKEYLLKNENYELNPLAIIPELNTSLYSRCLMYRMDDNSNLTSVEDSDCEYIVKYLSE